MAKNVLRAIKNRVNADARMAAEIVACREQALQRAEQKFSALFGEQQKRDFYIDMIKCHIHSPIPEDYDHTILPDCSILENRAKEIRGYLSEQNLKIDRKWRGVFSLTKEQAVKIARLVVEWNKPWRQRIARKYNDDPDALYDVYDVKFWLADGLERQVEIRAANGTVSQEWRWESEAD